jgi:hypothetical protein
MKYFLSIISIALATTGAIARDLVPAEQTAIFTKERGQQLLGVCYHAPESITGFWTPREEDLVGVEDELEAYLAEVRTKKDGASKDAARRLNWQDYFRQVVGVEIGGEKLLFISYYWGQELKNPSMIADRKADLKREGRAYDPEWWRKQIMAVSDGGLAYFRVLYDLKKRKFVWHEQNGNG